jgi:hypothetical protein
MKTFEIGKSYTMRYIGDHNLTQTFEVIDRTSSTITVKTHTGNRIEVKKLRIVKALSEYSNAETVRPEGNFAKCPILKAE